MVSHHFAGFLRRSARVWADDRVRGLNSRACCIPMPILGFVVFLRMNRWEPPLVRGPLLTSGRRGPHDSHVPHDAFVPLEGFPPPAAVPCLHGPCLDRGFAPLAGSVPATAVSSVHWPTLPGLCSPPRSFDPGFPSDEPQYAQRTLWLRCPRFTRSHRRLRSSTAVRQVEKTSLRSFPRTTRSRPERLGVLTIGHEASSARLRANPVTAWCRASTAFLPSSGESPSACAD